MNKAELLESIKCLSEIVEKSCKDDVLDAGDIVRSVLDETDIDCTYETVRKMVSAITHYSDSTKMSLAKCLKEDGWTDGQCDGAVLNLKAIDTNVPLSIVARDLYDGLDQHQKELLLELASNLIPFFLRDEDLHVNELSDIIDDSSLAEWAHDNGWKHPEVDSISDFVEDMGSSEVRDFVVEYIQDNL